MNETISYQLPQALLQAIVDNLNAQPAGQTRPLLNGIEAECKRQDDERAKAVLDAQRHAIEKDVMSKLQVATAPVQAPALPELDLNT